MSALLSNDWIRIPLFSICIFLICYLWADRVLIYLHRKSLGSRDEVLRLLDLMFVEVDRRQVTMIMLLVSFGFGIILFFLLWPNVFAGLLFGSAVTVFGWSLPLMMVKNLYERRCHLFVSQMMDGLTIMANSIGSGLSVQQAMERVVENMPNPISQEFNLVLSQMRIGRSLEEALNEMGDRIPNADLQMFVTSINILKETGGNMAETFETIVVTIRERQKIEKKIEAMTAQGIMQGLIVSVVPLALIALFLVVDPGYITPMFNTTLGLILLFIMFALQIIGGITIRRLVKIEV